MDPQKRQEILHMVRKQLQRSNPPSTEALYGRAVRIDESIRDLSLRQFNARFPLQVRREMAETEKQREESAQNTLDDRISVRLDPERMDRAALRQVFYDLAVDVAGAKSGPN